MPRLPRASRARCPCRTSPRSSGRSSSGSRSAARSRERALFHRKHYLYPDLPKGYQISQYDEPLCVDGRFVVPGPDGDVEVGIVRAHLEEDAAKTIHVGGATGRIVGAAHSNVDFNRGGTPLVEIVTRPDLRSADDAKRFLQLLRQTIVELGISDAEMEKGPLRADANVSVREVGETGFRTRTELKNMNSFNHIAARHRGGGRGGRSASGSRAARSCSRRSTTRSSPTRSRRRRPRRRRTTTATSPSPISSRSSRGRAASSGCAASCPSCRATRIRRFEREYGLPFYDAEVLNGSAALAALYERVALDGVDAKAASNVLMNEFAATGVDPDAVTPTSSRS